MGRGGTAPLLLLASLAVVAGGLFLWSIGALPGMATRNILAFAVGLLAGWAGHKLAAVRMGAVVLFGVATAVLGLVLVAGTEIGGVRRWLALGPLNVQPGLILAPLLLAIVAGQEGRHWRVAILLPILLVALQPDAATLVAMSGSVAALAAAVSIRSSRGWTPRRIALAVGVGSLAVVGMIFTGVQTPPPVAFVEGTVGIAATSGTVAMLLHALAIVLALAALLSAGGPSGVAMAAYFALAALAAIFWAFPMPIAGAGPSHMVGFGLAIGWLAERHASISRGK